MSETTAPQLSSCAGTIRARDFGQKVTDENRDMWFVGQMRHLIKAIAGKSVIACTDTRTGHTQVNVQLLRLRQTPGFGGHQVLIAYRWGTGENDVNYTWTSLFNIGAIVVMDDRGATFEARRTYAEEQSAARAIVRRLVVEAHGEDHPDLKDAEFDVATGEYEVSVYVKPRDIRSPLRHLYHVTLGQVAEELARRAALVAAAR